jgi:hypothetical protein
MPSPSLPDALFLDRVPSPIGAMLVVHDTSFAWRKLIWRHPNQGLDSVLG